MHHDRRNDLNAPSKDREGVLPGTPEDDTPQAGDRPGVVPGTPEDAKQDEGTRKRG